MQGTPIQMRRKKVVCMECILVKISDISPPFSYVRNTYPNEKEKDGILTRIRESLVLIPVGKFISIFSKCQHLPQLRVPKDF
jgi:hypothetical protein